MISCLEDGCRVCGAKPNTSWVYLLIKEDWVPTPICGNCQPKIDLINNWESDKELQTHVIEKTIFGADNE